MHFKSYSIYLNRIAGILLKWEYATHKVVERHIKSSLGYFRSSETIFLLIFANIIGIGAGFGAIVFRWLIAFFQKFFFTDGGHLLSFMGNYYVIILPAAGGLIVGLLTYFFSKESKGHGVPEVMLAVTSGGSRIRPRVAAIKAFASSICIGSGGSVGREGPIVQIASALGSTLGQVFRLTEEKSRILIACGAAGGIAATFNAPLAGIFFALEVILREYGIRYFSSVVLSAVTATAISRTFLGASPAFVVPAYELSSSWDMLFYFFLGILAALAGLVFIKLLYGFEDFFNRIKIPEYVKPAVGGLFLGGIGIYFPQVFGVGYSTIELTLENQLGPMLILGLVGLKIVATSLTLGSGGSGGIFSPSLFIGVMLGSSFGSLVHFLFPSIPISIGAYALVGMGAVFAGAAQAPISAIIILFEMTDDYKFILPLMIACVISTLVFRRFSKDSIYTLKLTRKGINLLNLNKPDFTEKMKVSEIMFRKIITVNETTQIKNAGLLIRNTTHRGFPVLDNDKKLTGIVTHHDINDALNDGRADRPVSEIMSRDLVCCFPDETLKSAFEKLGEKNIGRIPVVDRDDPRRLVGLVTRKSIIAAYSVVLKDRKIQPEVLG